MAAAAAARDPTRGWLAPPRTPGQAIASLILGIIGIVLCPMVTSVVGLIFGYSAKREIDNSGGRLGGRGVAMGGIITAGSASRSGR